MEYIKKKIVRCGALDGIQINTAIKLATGFDRGDIVRIYCEKGKMIIELDKTKKEEN